MCQYANGRKGKRNNVIIEERRNVIIWECANFGKTKEGS